VARPVIWLWEEGGGAVIQSQCPENWRSGPPAYWH